MVSAPQDRLGVKLGKVVKSNSHCDYVVQLDDTLGVVSPPNPEDYGFGSFVKLESQNPDRHWAVGLIYNSQLFNPQFLNSGPRLSSEPNPLFTPDLVTETRILLGTVLIGSLEPGGDRPYGRQGIPRVVVPVNTPVVTMTEMEIHHFHCDRDQKPQFCYLSQLLRYGGTLAPHLAQQVLGELYDSQRFTTNDKRALAVLCKDLAWKNTVGTLG